MHTLTRESRVRVYVLMNVWMCTWAWRACARLYVCVGWVVTVQKRRNKTARGRSRLNWSWGSSHRCHQTAAAPPLYPPPDFLTRLRSPLPFVTFTHTSTRARGDACAHHPASSIIMQYHLLYSRRLWTGQTAARALHPIFQTISATFSNGISY